MESGCRGRRGWVQSKQTVWCSSSVPNLTLSPLAFPHLDVWVRGYEVDSEGQGVGSGLVARKDEGLSLSHDLCGRCADTCIR